MYLFTFILFFFIIIPLVDHLRPPPFFSVSVLGQRRGRPGVQTLRPGQGAHAPICITYGRKTTNRL